LLSKYGIIPEVHKKRAKKRQKPLNSWQKRLEKPVPKGDMLQQAQLHLLLRQSSTTLKVLG
jgi:hypothetical protein